MKSEDDIWLLRRGSNSKFTKIQVATPPEGITEAQERKKLERSHQAKTKGRLMWDVLRWRKGHCSDAGEQSKIEACREARGYGREPLKKSVCLRSCDE